MPAKINLALCVGPVREDGYHPLGTVFHAVSLFDDLTLTAAKPGEAKLTVQGEWAEVVPTDETNLAVKAIRLLERVYGPQQSGVEMVIHKAIPVAGGMAGGSADGAAALLAGAVFWDLDIQPAELLELAAELGSDVPFSLMGGTAIGTGRGEKLTPLLTRGVYHWVLALADQGLSTPEVFAKFDEIGNVKGTEIPSEMLAALTAGDVHTLAATMRNDLQEAALDLRPELAETLEAGLKAGALASLVSGAGPTCAFLAASETDAIDLENKLLAAPQVASTRRATGPAQGAMLTI